MTTACPALPARVCPLHSLVFPCEQIAWSMVGFLLSLCNLRHLWVLLVLW